MRDFLLFPQCVLVSRVFLQLFQFHRGYIPDLQLEIDDILAIQVLYGKPGSRPSNRPSPKDPVTFDEDDVLSNNLELCDKDRSIDDLFQTQDGVFQNITNKFFKSNFFNLFLGSYYVFKGSNYWKVTS